MSEAASNAFHKVISDRQFFGKSLVGALASAILSSALLAGISLSICGVAQLLDSGDLASAENGIAGKILSASADRIAALRSSGSALTTLFAMFTLCVLLRAVFRSSARNQVARHVSGGVNRLREHIQRQALRCNPGDLSGIQTKSAASLFQSTAVDLERAAVNWGVRRLTTCVDVAVLFAILMTLQWRLGLECVIPVIVCWCVSRIEAERHAASADLLAAQVDRGLEKLTEHLDKSRLVSGYGMESLEHQHFSIGLQSYQERYDILRKQEARGRWTTNLIYAAMFLLPAFIIARHLVSGSLIDLPAAAAIATVLCYLVISLHRIQDVAKYRGTATVAADAINHYLLRVPSVSQVVGARFLEPMSRLLQFDQVSVETETNPDLLSSLDLKITSGQRLALLSLDPNEARALVSLIVRFNDPTSGQVLIDGQDIRKVTLESLRAEAVVVGGDEPVFNATVLENITAGQSGLSRQDAIEACKVAHAESFIRQLPKGYETHLGDHDALPGVGHRFRLSLARAIARNPALLIIQEPESPLDSETKAMLDDTYQRICNDRTVIFLPTRLSTVKKCDRIVVLHEGRVAVDGVHEDLVRTSDLYRHWEYVRFNVFR